MRGWIILGAVLLAFLLLGQIRLGALARYGAEGLLAQVKVGFFRLTIYPIREKAPKKEKKKREKKKPKEEPPKGTPPPEHTGPGGKVELVRAHMRGNPLKGVIVHRHIIRRVDEDAGEWKGGPLPPNQIIRELWEPDSED